ncbi:MAG TPA: hypothetical protein VJH22_04735 [Candidatus Nanoarchaeia archaeon]|nr:hypothetical protein [Candidatus Nanoarchaeia archaeon]
MNDKVYGLVNLTIHPECNPSQRTALLRADERLHETTDISTTVTDSNPYLEERVRRGERLYQQVTERSGFFSTLTRVSAYALVPFRALFPNGTKDRDEVLETFGENEKTREFDQFYMAFGLTKILLDLNTLMRLTHFIIDGTTVTPGLPWYLIGITSALWMSHHLDQLNTRAITEGYAKKAHIVHNLSPT